MKDMNMNDYEEVAIGWENIHVADGKMERR